MSLRVGALSRQRWEVCVCTCTLRHTHTQTHTDTHRHTHRHTQTHAHTRTREQRRWGESGGEREQRRGPLWIRRLGGQFRPNRLCLLNKTARGEVQGAERGCGVGVRGLRSTARAWCWPWPVARPARGGAGPWAATWPTGGRRSGAGVPGRGLRETADAA